MRPNTMRFCTILFIPDPALPVPGSRIFALPATELALPMSGRRKKRVLGTERRQNVPGGAKSWPEKANSWWERAGKGGK